MGLVMNLAVKRAIGLMSGTSADGVDAAIIETDGVSILARGPYEFVAYNASEQSLLQEQMREMAGLSHGGTSELAARRAIVDRVSPLVTARHIDAVRRLMSVSGFGPMDIDVIGFHGQTLFHDAAQHVTLQAGSGPELACALGMPVVHELRQSDLQAGGQGAPLVPVYHQALATEAGLELPVVIVNIGGVANVTYIGPSGDGAGSNELLAFDTGPGNGLLNDWVFGKCGEPMDAGGAYARRGAVDERIVADFLEGAYFKKAPPKSLDRHEFSTDALRAVTAAGLTLEDGAATLVEMTVRSIAVAEAYMAARPKRWVVVGGGAKNEHMMQRLAAVVSAPVCGADEFGWQGNFVEAEAFGFLAVRHLAGLPLTFPGTTGVMAPQVGGQLAEV